MERPTHLIGIDISAETFNAADFTSPGKKPIGGVFANNQQGFDHFLSWLTAKGIGKDNSLICVEGTGVYGERLSYYMHAKGFPVAIEAPQKVKRAFEDQGKTDEIDARQIAEYAYRFFDKLSLWSPSREIVEQIQVLLSTREHFTEQLTANLNIHKSFKRKIVQTPQANTLIEKTIDQLKAHIKEIDKEIQNLIDQDPHFRETVVRLKSIPSIGLLFCANLLVITDGFTREVSSNQIAAYLGIAPFKHESGTTVYHPPQSRRAGPHRLRKLLYLATLTLIRYSMDFKKYFLRKTAEGKPKRLVMNNMENKLLRIVCAVLKSGKPYIPGYRSINPALLAGSH
jgi:transposase